MTANYHDPLTQFVINKYTSPDQIFLDVGCASAPYRVYVPGKYIGMDFTNDAYAEGVERRVDLIGEAENIPMEGSSVDIVFSRAAFFLATDHKKALAEFQRVLKPGGRIILMDYNRRTQRRFAKLGHAPSAPIPTIHKPCWTQWGLLRLVQRCGYRDAQIVTPTGKDVPHVERLARLAHQEMFGQWAIVTAITES